MNYAVLGPGENALTNITKNNARNLIKNNVLNSYFNGEWKNRNQSQNYSVWNTNGKMVGFALIQRKQNPKSKKIMLIGTSQGRGVGRILMNKIINNAKYNKYKHIVLNSVPTAKGFYKKFGFEVVSNNNNHINMVLNLTARPKPASPNRPKSASPNRPKKRRSSRIAAMKK